MARTKITARKAPEQEKKQQGEIAQEQGDEVREDYSKMTNAELKKVLKTRKINGRSKLTKKENMIKVLELFDQEYRLISHL
jgi:hypothetical protein